MTMNCAGVVLAGGASSRMGLDKALLRFDKKLNWLEQAQLLLCGFCHAGVWISGRTDAGDSMPDRYGFRGPLAAVLNISFLHNDSIEAVIFVPIDMPDLKVSTLMALMKAIEAKKDIEAVFSNSSPLPVILRNSRVLHKKIEKFVDVVLPVDGIGDRAPSLKRFLLSLNHQEIVLPEDQLKNINTPEEYAIWLNGRIADGLFQ